MEEFQRLQSAEVMRERVDLCSRKPEGSLPPRSRRKTSATLRHQERLRQGVLERRREVEKAGGRSSTTHLEVPVQSDRRGDAIQEMRHRRGRAAQSFWGGGA